MEDSTNRGIVTAIIVIIIIIAAISVWPRTSVAYTYPTAPVVQRVVPQHVVSQPSVVQTVTPRTTTSTVMTTRTYQYQPPSTTHTYYYEQEGNGGICTMEARQCPDGSYVGRSGPSCEFSACPN